MRHCPFRTAIGLPLLLLLPTACAGNGMATGSSDAGGSNPYTSDGNHDECGNGMDDDGDGQIDEGCFCGSGETQPCFTGQYTQREVGGCADGVQRCVTEGGSESGHWGPCEGDTVASEELCEGAVDEDCDGAVNESCPCTEGETQACGVEFIIPPCMGGLQTCSEGAWTACDGAVGPAAELCDDEVDNDCDGETDEGCGCVPVPEVCGDRIDNDCDGDIDEPACESLSGMDGGTPEIDGGATEVDAGTVGTDAGTLNACDETPPPVCSERATGIVDIAGDARLFCARHEDGRVFCWGNNLDGGLGVGAPGLRNSPTALEVISGAQKLAVGGHVGSACVIVGGGQVKCWGRRDIAEIVWSPETPPEAVGLTNIVDIVVDGHGFFAQDPGGTIWAWGYDGAGGLGDGDEVTPFGELTQVTGITDAIALDGGGTTCAVRADGSVWCWGVGTRGQTGPVTTVGLYYARHSPNQILGIDDAVDVRASMGHVCALRQTGEVACWGQAGLRGEGRTFSTAFTTAAAPVPGLMNVRKLETGEYGTCAITCSGEVWCWGRYTNGWTNDYERPLRITGIGPVTDVALGHLPGLTDDGEMKGAICVIEECGRVLCWGANLRGEAATGTYDPVFEPTEAIGLP